MCIAIYKPAGADIASDTLHRCWTHHPHGGGLAVPDGNGGVVVRKAMTWDEFLAEWTEHTNPSAPMLIHFRWATHGAINLDNCHPHRINDDLVMIHNGVIKPMTIHSTDRRSDTAAFVDQVLRQMPIESVTSPGVSTLLEDYIGRSRLVFLDGHGDVSIIGEQRGEWANGCWFSNDTYHRTPVRRPTTRIAPTATPVDCYDTDQNREERRSAAHDLLDRCGPDLSLWNDQDLETLAMAYNDELDNDKWEEVA